MSKHKDWDHLFIWLPWVLVVAWKTQLPDQGLNLGSLHWERGVLGTGPPGKSQDCELLLDIYKSLHLSLWMNLMIRSLLGSSVHGIIQARTLEWVAGPSSCRSSQHRDQTHISYFYLRWQAGSLAGKPPHTHTCISSVPSLSCVRLFVTLYTHTHTHTHTLDIYIKCIYQKYVYIFDIYQIYILFFPSTFIEIQSTNSTV